MLDSILDEAVSAFAAEGINAFREYPEKRADLKNGVSVSVGIGDCKCLSSGMGEYLGMREGSGGETDTELFGRKLELTLKLVICSPFGETIGADACVQCADSLRNCLGSLPSGLKALDIETGEVKADDKLGCYKCICKLRCLAFLVAESSGSETEFLNFVLKGTVDSGN